MAEVKIYNQDCIAAMNNIDADSVDLIVTDPPYNLGNFMKNRDTMKAVPVTAWRTSNISLPESAFCGAQRPLVRCQRSLSGDSGRSCQSVVWGLITTV